MDFSQTKLTASEWESLERPVKDEEKKILNMIYNAYDNPEYTYNENQSLLNIMKLHDDNKDSLSNFLFFKYFDKNLRKLNEKYDIGYTFSSTKKASKIKKTDTIKIDLMDKKMDTIKQTIYEFSLYELLEKLLRTHKKKSSKFMFYYYTLIHMLKYKIDNLNTYIIEFINFVLELYKKHVSMKELLFKSDTYVEKNEYLLKYKDIDLYDHQKQLFTITKNKLPKLILYQAPTGTGKTISPIGLAKSNKVIFVCAAKHVGLQLAKSCISMEIPIAVAFGCKDPSDIRLHYFAAKDFVKNRKTGGIFKVDNSVGDKVQVIISDIQSYISSMNYMLAFNNENDIITYWDEPTITLDYNEHTFHDILRKNWTENLIPNVVLSSATLPNEKELHSMISFYKMKFGKDARVYNIISHECKKTIPIINSDGFICLPHTLYNNREELRDTLSHCSDYKTLMRHFDIKEIIKFIKFIDTENYIEKDAFKIESYFDNIENITPNLIKCYYIDLLTHVSKKWNTIYKKYIEMDNLKKVLESSIYVTTKDAHTLTDGPTIYMADDIEKLAKTVLKMSSIPVEKLEVIMKNIVHNSSIKEKINKLEKELKEHMDKIEECSGGDKAYERAIRNDTKIKDFNSMIEKYSKSLKKVNLDDVYIPNKKAHLKKYGVEDKDINAYSSNVDEYDVEKIMMTDVNDIWKLILLLGIGVFTDHSDIKYIEIMKKLALEQKLYMIFASTDYIYGTNYQFTHGYIGKDLTSSMTQEKVIQAFGRVGRGNLNQNYSIRIRDNSILDKVFKKELNKMEIVNMNRLFGLDNIVLECGLSSSKLEVGDRKIIKDVCGCESESSSFVDDSDNDGDFTPLENKKIVVEDWETLLK
jgi:hypothetical protein